VVVGSWIVVWLRILKSLSAFVRDFRIKRDALVVVPVVELAEWDLCREIPRELVQEVDLVISISKAETIRQFLMCAVRMHQALAAVVRVGALAVDQVLMVELHLRSLLMIKKE
jgi:hypothetical protein